MITTRKGQTMRRNEFLAGLVYNRATDCYTHPDAPGVMFDGIGQAIDYYNKLPRK